MLRCCDKARVIAALDSENLRAGAFLKSEGYPLDPDLMTKYPRSINAYTDETKAMYGPLFRAIEAAFFGPRNPYAKHFVKKVAVTDRPALIEATFGDEPVVLADFSSFECMHRGHLARAVAHAVWSMVSEMDAGIAQMLSAHMLDVNQSLYKGRGIKTQVTGTLMSGAVWTSLANCMLNFFLLSYMRLKAASPSLTGKQLAAGIGSFVGLFEGDDSITAGQLYCPALIKGLGLKLKCSYHRDCTTASFCGIIKARGSNAIITDPLKVLGTFFVLDAKFGDCKASKEGALLRAKALSYYYPYSGCPIVGELAFAVLQRTKSITPNSSMLSYHQAQIYLEASGSKSKFYCKEPQVDAPTRALFAELYGLDVEQQLSLEKSLRQWGRGCEAKIELPRCFERYQDWTLMHAQKEPVYVPEPFGGACFQDPSGLCGKGVFNMRMFLELGDHPSIYVDAKGKRLKFKSRKEIIHPSVSCVD